MPCGFENSSTLTLFLLNLHSLGLREECPYSFNIGINMNYKPADYARNVGVKQFLSKPDYSRLWMLDSDMMPSMDCAKILATDGDIVCGNYDIWGAPGPGGKIGLSSTTYLYDKEIGMWESIHVPPNVAAKVDAAGTGMMVIRRHVLEDKRMWLADEGENYVPIFRNQYHESGRIQITEDLDFCRRATALGYSVIVNGSVYPGHVKTVNVKDISNYGVERYKKGIEDGRASLVSSCAT